MADHSEPWKVLDTPERCFIHDAEDRYVAVAKSSTAESEPFGIRQERARRIVACVNACKGIDTEELELLGTNAGKVLRELLDMPIKVFGQEPKALLLEHFINWSKAQRTARRTKR